MYVKPKYNQKPQPNVNLLTAETYTNEFLQETTNETAARIGNLITRNGSLTGAHQGYTYQGITYTQVVLDSTVYVPPIDPSLEKDAEALYLRAERLTAMRTKLQQALVSILGRCGGNIQTFRDALPEKFVECVSLSVFPRMRTYDFLLKTNPMLAAPYRVIDEAILYRDRYRLLD